jgi:hypothetical protein
MMVAASGRKPRPGLQRGVVPVLLHVVGEEQEHGEDRAAGDEHSQERAAARAVSDNVEGQ